jgi:hypothetical protein
LASNVWARGWIHRSTPSSRATSRLFISAAPSLPAAGRPPTANPDKYADELLDAHLSVEDAHALYAEYATQRVEFTRGLGNTPWRERGFVVKDCDGRLLAFGKNL